MTKHAQRMQGVLGVLIILVSGCATEKGAADYVTTRIEAVKTESPSNMNQNGMGARTFRYWQTAAAYVAICSDTTTVPVSARIDYIGPQITEKLRQLPTREIDNDAVKSVHFVADRFDPLRPLYKAFNFELERFGASIGLSAAKAFSQALDSGAFDPDNPDAVSNLLNAAGKLKISGAAGIKAAALKLGEQEKGINAYLEATRKTLSNRYRAEFPQFSVTNPDSLLRADEFGYCLGSPITFGENLSNMFRLK
jgi:hypothetical protein